VSDLVFKICDKKYPVASRGTFQNSYLLLKPIFVERVRPVEKEVKC